MKEKIRTCFTLPCGEIIELYVEGNFISDNGQLIDWLQRTQSSSVSLYLIKFNRNITSICAATGCRFLDGELGTDIRTKRSKYVAISSLVQSLIQLSTLFYHT